MIPIEQTSDGMLVFLKCGCAALRGRSHPTGAAVLVLITQPCDEHCRRDLRIQKFQERTLKLRHYPI